MSVIYTEFCNFGKPTVGNSYNVWGTEHNTVLDQVDAAVISNNFAEDESSHSGLDFGYKNGIVANGTTITNVSGSTITLTDDDTNYVEVDNDGTVSANTTSFTTGKIPLFTVLTASGSISTVTNKRCYFSVPVDQFWSSNGSHVKTTLTLNINDLLVTDTDGNVLVNGASAETNQEGGLSLKQGTQNPTTNSVDQVSLFATSGGNSTLGLITEAGLVNSDLIPLNYNTELKYLYARQTALAPVAAYIGSTQDIVNTTTETTLLEITLPGNSNPITGIKIHLIGNLNSANAAHQNTVKLYMGSATTSITSQGAVLSNEQTVLNWVIFIKGTNAHAYSLLGSFGNYNWAGRSDLTSVDWSSDQTIKVTTQWSHADAGSNHEVYAGFIEILF